MKSFKKLRDLARQGGKAKDKHNYGNDNNRRYEAHGVGYVEPTEDAELVTNGMKDIRSIQKKYESLVSLSTEVSHRAYDLSTAVSDMASYFVAPGVLDDQDIGKIFKLVGEVQFVISQSLELYASHVTQTVTTPTENLIGDLRDVMETKKQYDERRQSLYHHRLRIAKGRSKIGKTDAQEEEQLENVREQFEEVSQFLGDRLLSLRQGRPRSLITQTARHHAAQMQLFSKVLTSLHGIEPHMKQVTKELNIDRHLSSADGDVFNDEIEDDEDVSDIEHHLDDAGSYFDDADEEKEHHHVREDDLGSESSEIEANSRLNMSREWSSHMASGSDRPGNSENEGDSPLPRWIIKGSKSAPSSPLTASQGVDDVDRAPPTYVSAVLPPTRSPPHVSDRGHSGVLYSDTRPYEHKPSTSEQTSPRHHNGTPGQTPRFQGRATKMGVPMSMFPPFDPSQTTWPMPLPPPSDPPPILKFPAPTAGGFIAANSGAPGNKHKRYSYSGPLTSSSKPRDRAYSSDVPSSGPLRPFPSSTTWSDQSRSPKLSPSISPSKVSPPQISELHKLPPPPLGSSSSPIAASSSLIAHSAPLHRHADRHASPLPPPPLGNASQNLSVGGAGKLQNIQRYKGLAISEDEERAIPSVQPVRTSHSGHSGLLTTPSNPQIGHKSPSLQRSVSGCGVSAAPRHATLHLTAPGRVQSGSGDKKMWRLNTTIHSSPSLSLKYSVESPPSIDSFEGKERPRFASSDFETARRSLDMALTSGTSNNTKQSKWSKWRSFSAHDGEDLSMMSQLGTKHHHRDSLQAHGYHASPRLGTTTYGVRHV
ncbi:uncharacterized protein [Physcomitrium patens]|uniref:BAR domain-containing protein n=1 Tax=Physcomitrium patens TaxID=3218 RepID=A0A2K1K9T7_PHYPA|nr:uncharacterized protein At2g33490-like isoform X1 [Physcomitrium patens]XP_024380660.1 uncharacterized protein At2g33490-like isoform X1 [Physcomitrium patens]XP_024380661.1 uncharacterized protein At2g33490-like isoform X1 [Physcomitrium patens]XP_024380662.1 uncharacterized protein At2g33490-like isoform X1 [Physcomitrium patens]XP_024380663.1 uncharacterized protein At2g33490-like isoform X1 [Physcomitrium patens]XP_024380664.1 uncharacterized protein At2g33490-like isoform X1 [Physcomit|eukprot:XP_024380659.1 uncharacterized protein At2g33490-like isoform X1 [Physcomitrella patens]